MKRVLSFLLTLSLLSCVLVGCTEEPSSSINQNPTEEKTEGTENVVPTGDSSDPPETTPLEPQLEKLTEQVFRSSDFSEGLATVVAGGKNGRGCVINKKGEIVFDLGFEIENSYVVSFCEFVNGYMFINGGILDKKGNMTYPEDVGAATFYPVALEDGYIFAEVIESGFASTKKLMGILNTDFDWIVEPSEQLHASVSYEYGSPALSQAINSMDYYHDGYVYIEGIGKYVNVKTGEVINQADAGLTPPSETWQVYSDGTYRDYDENIRLDLSMYENLYPYSCGSFIDGKALIVFRNAEANTSYFTVVNENGDFLFEPVDFMESNIGSIQTDGITIVVTDESFGTKLAVKTYDMKGCLIAEFDTDTIGKYCNFTVSIGDGVIMINGAYNYSNYVWYYTTKFEPLF